MTCTFKLEWESWRLPPCGWCCQSPECLKDWLSHPDYSRTWGNYLWVNLAWVGAVVGMLDRDYCLNYMGPREQEDIIAKFNECARKL